MTHPYTAGGDMPGSDGAARESVPRIVDPPPRWPERIRQVVNVLNLSTPLGLALALAGRARVGRGPRGVLLAWGYRARIPAPHAPAVTIGDVVLLRIGPEKVAERPGLLAHEVRHCTQWACWLGPLGFLPAYLLASAWSWLHTRDFALRNAFESRAGLADGGYLRPDPPTGGAGGQAE